MNFEVYKKSSLTSFGEPWQWQLKTSSGKIVAKGASYPDLKSCMQAIVLVKHEGLGARVVNPKNGLTFLGVDEVPVCRHDRRSGERPVTPSEMAATS
jgi:uncharacterized protein YegP (UPF0339 family)